VKLFLDECLSPNVANELSAEGSHYVIHPRNNGGRGDPDHKVLERCFAEDLVIVTENAKDFRALAERSDIHPGIIILPCVGKAKAKALIEKAIEYLNDLGAAGDVIVNHVLEIDELGTIEMYELPVS
jgi:predicted nuclease of predicted toxin-antitoxin system